MWNVYSDATHHEFWVSVWWERKAIISLHNLRGNAEKKSNKERTIFNSYSILGNLKNIKGYFNKWSK